MEEFILKHSALTLYLREYEIPELYKKIHELENTIKYLADHDDQIHYCHKCNGVNISLID